MKDNQQIGVGWIDMSSNEPHSTVTCPLCGNMYMKKVELDKVFFTTCCHVEYRMTHTEIKMTLTKEQAEIYFGENGQVH